MAKIVKLFFFIALCLSTILNAHNYTNELNSYDKKILTSNDDELLRVHHALKSLYIESIIKNDNTLKKDVLQRLIKTANTLKLDSKGYQKELNTLQKSISKNVKIPKPQTKKTTVAKQKKVIKKLNVYSKYLPKLIHISNKIDKLELSFDKKLSFKDIKTFQLRGKTNYREVFDIKAILSYSPNIRTPEVLDDLRIAQYSDKVLRIVFQKKEAIKSRIVLRGSKIELFYNMKAKKKAAVTKQSNSKKYKKIVANDKIIVIDPGHGGKDSGAIGSRRKYEKNAVLQIALRTGKILQKRGYKIYYTRSRDTFIRLRSRTQYANKKGADLFLSIHANASSKKLLHGVETFFLSPDRSNRSKGVAALENKSDIKDMDYFSKQTFLNVFNREKIISANKLALDVQQGMLNRLKSKYSSIRDGGVREAPFWVLVGAQMPAILIETGYITHATERTRLFNSHYQDLLAKGIADGIDSYFMKSEY